jgi:hypothetical protein
MNAVVFLKRFGEEKLSSPFIYIYYFFTKQEQNSNEYKNLNSPTAKKCQVG